MLLNGNVAEREPGPLYVDKKGKGKEKWGQMTVFLPSFTSLSHGAPREIERKRKKNKKEREERKERNESERKGIKDTEYRIWNTEWRGGRDKMYIEGK